MEEIDTVSRLIKVAMLFIIIAIILTIGLILQIQSTHDCSHDRSCTHTTEPPDKDDPFDVKIEKLQLMIKECDGGVTWTMSLLVAMIASFPVIYYIDNRLPTLKEWIFITFIVFIIVYFAMLWLATHFHRPNLMKLQDAVYDFGIEHCTKKSIDSF